jgi:glycogen(starch) synthase
MDTLEANYGYMRRTAVIPNGRTRPATAGVLKEPIVFSGGRIWDEGKNLTQLMKVADGLDWPVYVAGDATSPNGGGVDAATSVTLLGSLPANDLRRWLRRSSIFALPAKYEPFGLLPLEAAQAGCALVLGDIPSLREVWQDSAVFVDTEDDDELAEAVNRLARDRRYRNAIAQKALRRAANFSSHQMAEGYLNIYTQLLSRYAARHRPLEVSACV